MLDLTEIEVWEGADEEVEVQFVTAGNLPYDVSPLTIRLQVKSDLVTEVILADLPVTVTDGPNGLGTVTLPAGLLAEPGVLPFRVRQTAPVPRTLGAGRLLIRDT